MEGETKKISREQFQGHDIKILDDQGDFKKVARLDDVKDVHEVPFSKVQEYWNERPCNINHSKEKIGSLKYFNEITERRYRVEPHIAEFADFRKWKGKRVLEIGCGIGADATSFAAAGAEVTCVEASQVSLDVCKSHFKEKGLDAQFYVGSAEALEDFLPEKKFDLVWSFGVIHHTPNPEKVLNSLKRYIHKDTELRIMVYTKVSYKLFFLMRETDTWDFSKTDKILTKFSEAQTGCPVTYTYTQNGVENLFKDFNINRLEKAHIFRWKIPEYRQGQLVPEDCWKDVPEETVKEFAKELGWHWLVYAKLK